MTFQPGFFKLKNVLKLKNSSALSRTMKMTWQCKPYSSKENDENGDSEKVSENLDEKNKQSKASKKLTALLSNIKIEESLLKENKTSIHLAKPGRAKTLKDQTYKKHIEKITPNITKAQESKFMEKQLTAAVSEVAESLGGDIKKTESELLQRLKSHAIIPKDGDKESANFSDIFVGMKIDRDKQTAQTKEYSQTYDPTFKDISNFSKSFQPMDQQKKRERMFRTPPTAIYQETDLYGRKPLGFYKIGAKDDEEPKTLWKRLEEEELQLLVTHPPINAFEEMIRWTDEGKLWQFPINNEFGLDEEAKVGFEEHVFLEPLLEGFPTKGHIRHFMELVVVGLSKNPYISVERKKENINWFREYFKEKESILKEIGAIDRPDNSSSVEAGTSS